MGIETAIIVGAIVASTAQVAGGIEANRSARQKARSINKETEQAVITKQNEVTDFIGTQQTQFTKSGIDLSQSQTATAVLEETRREGDRQVAGIIRQGKAQASQARSQGRSALIAGIGGAGQTVANSAAGFA